MMINSRCYPLRSLTIRTFIMLEARHKQWKEGRRQQRALLDLVVELIRNYCNPMKNSNYIITGITTNVRGVVTVGVAKSFMRVAAVVDGAS
jgi:hypothetical protein